MCFGSMLHQYMLAPTEQEAVVGRLRGSAFYFTDANSRLCSGWGYCWSLRAKNLSVTKII